MILGGRIHEELGKDVQPALDAALSMTGSMSLAALCGVFLLSHFLGILFVIVYYISHENIMWIFSLLLLEVSYFTVLFLIC